MSLRQGSHRYERDLPTFNSEYPDMEFDSDKAINMYKSSRPHISDYVLKPGVQKERVISRPVDCFTIRELQRCGRAPAHAERETNSTQRGARADQFAVAISLHTSLLSLLVISIGTLSNRRT
ncbi:hypothetical protein EVAR_85473_1 [Eumeta japonica]|uniref:Uncharacterized protein n=1 Tax=Eumeta variegata TaxID=151549 RepID=A0A4C1VBR8_EUMVA|nr:hypothetical protein EVAR_85473_1 [Eumeta japonica]